MPQDNYIIGRIRAIEARLLDENKLIRMIDAADFESAFNILNESDYSVIFSTLPHPFDYEAMLQSALRELKYLSDTLAKDNHRVLAFWERFDCENMKILLKSKHKNIAPPRLLSYGNIDPELLANYILNGSGWLEKRTKELLLAAEKIYVQTENFLPVFDYIDEAYAKYFASTLEQNFSIEKAKYKTTGIEPLLGFLLNKTAEIKKIGLILLSKYNFVPSQKIKEQISP